jgi:curved DNA-binding protein CbpA
MAEASDLDRVLQATNAFSILGLAADASLDDAKKAYKELSRKLHPDKNTDPRATDGFQRIQRAYERMKDPIMRHMEMGAAPGAEAHISKQRAESAASAQHKAAAETAHKAATAAAQRERAGSSSGSSATVSSFTACPVCVCF